MIRQFTGRHMAATMIAFFGIVIAVNVVMAREAVRSFGGEVVQNSYVASQRFNHWLVAARAQRAAGWAMAASIDDRHRLIIRITRSGVAGEIAAPRVEADQPLDRPGPAGVAMIADGTGRFHSATALAPGHWRIRLATDAGGRPLRFETDVDA